MSICYNLELLRKRVLMSNYIDRVGLWVFLWQIVLTVN